MNLTEWQLAKLLKVKWDTIDELTIATESRLSLSGRQFEGKLLSFQQLQRDWLYCLRLALR